MFGLHGWLLRLEHVQQCFGNANLELKELENIVFKETVKVLGHVLSKECVRTNTDKLATMSQWPMLSRKKQVEVFSDSYYRRFVTNFTSCVKTHRVNMGRRSFVIKEITEHIVFYSCVSISKISFYFIAIYNRLTMQAGMLYRLWNGNDTDSLQLIAVTNSLLLTVPRQ